MSAPPSFSSFPELDFLNPPPQNSSSRDKYRDRPSKRTRRSTEPEEERDDSRRKESSSSSSRRRNRDRDDDQERRERKDNDRHRPFSHRDREKDLERDDRKRRDKDRSATSSSSHRPFSSALMPAPSTPPPSSASTVFYKDTRGDEANKTYGSLHAPSVAKFYRSGAGNIVGFPRGVKITRASSRAGGKTLEVEWNRPQGGSYSTPRYTDTSSRPLLSQSSRVRLLPASSDSSSTFLPSFIALPKSKPPPSTTKLIEGGQAHRSIHQESDSSPSDSDDEDVKAAKALVDGVFGALKPPDDKASSEEEEEEGETADSLVRTKNLYYSQKVKEDPLDVDAWLGWATFSSTVGFASTPSTTATASSRDSGFNPNTPSSHARSAIIVTHLTSALATTPSLANSSRFMLALLSAAAEVEPAAKVAERWDGVLEGPLGGEIDVWRAWGGWRMETVKGGSGGGGDVTGGWAEDGLARLRQVWDAEEERSYKREDVEGIEVYLLLRACLALKEAGYPERALAIMQAQIELTFFSPPGLVNHTFSDLLVSLEDFWDSEAPRFGEEGARGWSRFDLSSPQPAPPPSSSATLPPPPSPNDEVFSNWLTTETYASSTSLFSTRTTDPPIRLLAASSSNDDPLTNEDDPYHLVLFTDIKPFLFPIHSPNIKPHLFYSLFTFLNLPFTPPDTSTSMPFFSDPFLRNELAYSPSLRRSFWPDHLKGVQPGRKLIGEGGMGPEVEAGMGSPWEVPVKLWPVEVEGLFTKKGSGFGVLEKGMVEIGLRTFVSRALDQIRALYPDPIFALYAFSFEATYNPKAAIKLAKTVLASHRDSLTLWDGYARLERQRGKIDEARKVYVTALSLSSDEVKKMSAEGRGDAWKLWRGWVEMEWEQRDEKRVLQVIAAAAGPVGLLDHLLGPSETLANLTPTQILSTRQFYSQTVTTSLLPTSPHSLTQNTTHFVLLTSLFDYLTAPTSSLSLSSASDVYERFLASSTSLLTPLELEETWLNYTSLLYRHTTSQNASFRPAMVRTLMERAVAAFPRNTALLSLYAGTEMRMRFQNRVRRTVEEKVLGGEGEGVGGWLFAIWLELFMVKGRHNEWAVRRLLERALDRPSTRSSISLWRIAIEHEILLGQPARAKGLLYRAIKACPWSKDLYLLPFGPLRSVFTAKELEELSDLMADRKIRIRVGMATFLEGFAGDESEEDEGEMGEDERRLVREQEERRVLMPY